MPTVNGSPLQTMSPEALERWLHSLPDSDLTRDVLLVRELLLGSEGPLRVFYVPFDHVNTHARVVIAGITPGFEQMTVAIAEARDVIQRGGALDEAQRQAKFAAAFVGQMRRNLIAMLDGIGLAEHLRIPSSGALFGERRDLCHSTSVLRYPVFNGGENYTGHKPPIRRSPLLRELLDKYFRAELDQLPHALVIPLGKAVEAALASMEPRNAVIFGFPHPSGGNGHRVCQYAANRDALRAAVSAWVATSPHSRTSAR